MACQAGAIVCGGGDALATGLSWISGVFAKGKGAVEGVKKGIEFAQDPLGFITQQMQDAVHAVAGVLIPWLLSALHPNYDAQWWLKSYAVSFSISMFVLAVQLLIITSRRRKGSLGAKEMLESIFIAAPAFLIGAAFGPVVGIALTKVFTAAGDSIAAWAVNSTTQEFFTKIAELAAADDAGALLNSAIVSMFVLGTLFLSLLGVADTGIRQRCEVCGGVDHGPLRSDDAAISVAYAPGVVVAAAAHARAIGIDVERDAGALPGLDALFAPSPPPDAGGWTAIEAALKADGRGLRVDPATVVVADGRARVPGHDRTIAVHRVTGPAGYVVSLAIDPA